VKQLIEALHYKPENRGFDPRWCHRNFSLNWIFQPLYGPGIGSVSNRNEYQGISWWVKAAGVSDWQPYHFHVPIGVKSWEPQPPRALRVCPALPTVRKVTFLVKGKSVRLQAWSGPEVSRKLRFPDFMTTAQDVAKVVSLTHRPPLPPGNVPGTHFC